MNTLNFRILIEARLLVRLLPVALPVLLLMLWSQGFAAPQGGEVIAGNGSIVASDSQATLINQQSQTMSINWDSFNLARDEQVQFRQPNRNAISLNHILDQNPSQIFGRIDANGRVFLMNPNGIMFGESARINVGGLVAGAFTLDKDSFNGTEFPSELTVDIADGSVINNGSIEGLDGASIALLGNHVSNNGTISARLGKIHLLSADSATLSFDHDGLIQFAVNGEALQNLTGEDSAVINKGVLQAESGYVVMEASTANNIFTNVVNNSGVIQATRVINEGGVVRLEGSGGNVINSGAINVSGLNNNTGGTVTLMGDRVGVLGNASIDASGMAGGGSIAIGGLQRGEGDNTASFTQISKGAQLHADAINNGDGGDITVWANDTTWVYGELTARGGEQGGDGGFIEISGKQGLVLDADIDLRANNDHLGTLLLDPTDIVIHDQSGGEVPADEATLPDLSNATAGVGTFDIGELALESLAANANLVLEATNDITINNLADNNLNLVINSTGSVIISADTDNDGSGSFSMNSGDTITTAGALVNITAADITVGNITTNSTTDGAITIASTGNTTVGTLDAGTSTITINVDSNGNGNNSLTVSGGLTGSTVTLSGGADGGETLIGPDIGNSWTITGLNAGTLNGANFSNFPNLQGGTDNDVFTVTGIGNITGQIDGAGHATGDIINYSGASGLITVTINTDFTNVENLIGGGADYTLIAEDIANTWTITGQNDGTVAGIAFTDFSNLTGGSGVDDFVLSGGSVTGTINGNGNSDSLSANNTANTWNILTPNGGNVDSVFAFTSIENLIGGAGVDTFIVSSGSISGDIDGGSGTDSLAPANVANTWNITGVNQGNVTGIGSFTSIEELNGRNNTDTFTFADGASISGSVDGGGGSDSVDHSAQSGAVVVNIASGAYANIELYTGNNNSQLIADNIPNSWTINNAYDGSNDGTLNTITFVDFNNLTGGTDIDNFTISSGTLSGTIDGGGGIDTLAADNVANTWNITAADSGDVTGITAFTNIENLTGNNNTDDFIFADGSSISGAIVGGGNTDTVDFSLETGAVNVTIGATGFLNIESFIGNNTFSTLTGNNIVNSWIVTGANSGTVNTTSFSGFNDLIGGTNTDSFTISGGSISGSIDGGAGTDTLIGDNQANTWNIAGADSGSVDSVSAFSSMENLTGNTTTDDFVFADPGSISGSIDGGLGTDSINYSAKTGTVAVDLSGTGFSSIETYIGNNTDSTITGTNAPTTWTITGVNDGSINAVNFVDFNNLVGSDDVDDFIISGGSVSGSIAGGLGNDSLQGDNTGETWNITGADVGDSTNVAGFSAIETLLGGSGDDTFAFANGATYSGVINGGVGSDSIDQSAQLGAVTIDLASASYVSIENFIGNGTDSTITGSNTPNSWTIDGANSGDVNGIAFSDFTNLNGNASTDQFTLSGGSVTGTIDGASGNDTLIADDLVNTWTITGTDAGNVTGINAFSNIENITGGNQADSFVFLNTSSISGVVDGAAGSDSVDFSAEAGAVNITIGAADFNNIESFVGNNINSTLTGPAGNNIWTLTGNNDGTVGSVSFTDFNNLTGNVATDTFIFQTGSSITGLINGAGGVDTADNSGNAGIVTVTLDGLSYVNVESFIGNNTNSTLIGNNSANTWMITGANDGSVGSVVFSDFNNLTGNADTDAFVLTSGSISGTIDGGAGSDTLTGDNVANSWVITATNTGNVTGVTDFSNIENLSGNASTDSFTFNDGGDITGTINGGAGLDNVDQSAQSGLVNVILGASGYSNIESFNGNGINSTLTGDNINNSWILTGVDSGTVGTISFTNFSNLNGGSANDSFVLNGGSLSGLVDGGSGTDQIQAANTANTWNITGVDIGDVTGINSFTDIETLMGNAGSDNYVFANGSSFSGLINGAGNIDTIDHSSQVGAVLVSLDTGSYQNIEQFIGNSTNSTLQGPNLINTWAITATDAGTINGTSFSNFNNLLGNASADTFSIQGGDITGVVDGGSGNDTIVGDNLNNVWNVTSVDAGNVTGIAGFQNIDNLTGNSSVDTFNINDDMSGNLIGGAGDDIYNINNLVTIAGAINGGIGTDTINGPNLASAWIISAGDTGTLNGNSFTSIEDLNGGSGIDTFTITNAAGATASGIIDGGIGDDILNVDYTAASSRNIDFVGGLGSDTVLLTGSAANLTNSYIYGPASDQISITSVSGTEAQIVSASGIEAVADSMTAQTVSLTGTANADTMVLSPGSLGGSQPTSFQISGYVPTEFSNKSDLLISGAGGSDTLSVNGSVSYSGNITISVENIEEGPSGLLGADTLTMNQVTNVGLLATPLETSVNNLIINGPTSNVYLRDVNDIAVTADTISGALNIESTTGDITSAGAVIATGSSQFTVSNGHNIILDDTGNQFAGTPVFQSGGTINDITLVDNSALDLQALSLSGNLTLIADGAITQNGALLIQGNTVLDAGANSITLDSFANDFVGTVSLNNIGNNSVAILDQNALQFASSAIGNGSFTVDAGSISQSGPITQQANAGAVTMTSQSGPITLTNGANDFTGVVSLINLGGADTALADSSLLLLGSSDTNGGDLTVTAGNGVTLSGTTVSDNGDITITADGGDILLGRLNSGTGTITLNAVMGSIVGNNSQITDPNLTAQDLVIIGGDTIGEFNNPIAINISGTSFFDAGDGSANIIGYTGTILPGSILVNDVAFTALAIGQGQSVSYIVANQDEEDVVSELPLYSAIDGGVQMPKSFK